MKNKLVELLKKYVVIFINEYSNYLTNDQLSLLKNINYDNVFVFDNLTMPFGDVFDEQIYLSNVNEELIKYFKNMPNYNIHKSFLDNNNLSSYLKYMCENGYDVINLYSDILMYFIFFLVIKNSSNLFKGFINQEIHFLNIKYSLKGASLYAKEEKIATKITPYFKLEIIRQILFMDRPTSFKFLNDHFGFRYAKLVDNVSNLMDNQYQELFNHEYSGFDGLLEYVMKYDQLLYVNAYDCILNFNVQNNCFYF